MMLVMQLAIDFYAQEVGAKRQIEQAYVEQQVTMVARRMRMFEEIHWRYPVDLAELQAMYAAERNIDANKHPWLRYRVHDLSGGFDYSRAMVYAPNFYKSEDQTDYEQSNCGFVTGDFTNTDAFCLSGMAGYHVMLENRQHWLGRLSDIQQELYAALHKAADYYSYNRSFPVDTSFLSADAMIMKSGAPLTLNATSDSVELVVTDTGITQSGSPVSVARSFSF